MSKANNSSTFTTANNNITTTTTTFIEDSFFDINIKKMAAAGLIPSLLVRGEE